MISPKVCEYFVKLTQAQLYFDSKDIRMYLSFKFQSNRTCHEKKHKKRPRSVICAYA